MTQPAERLMAPLHPRMRERRVAVRRDAGRHRLRVALAGTGILAAFGAAYGATRSPLLDVDRVRVQGAVRTDPAAAQRAGLLYGRPQLADVDPARSAAGIERLPWVQKARVTRHWPGTVRVSLLERTALAALPAVGGGWALVDASGRVLERRADVPPGMTTVAAPQPAPGPGRQVSPGTVAALGVLERLPATLQGRVAHVGLADAGELEVELVDGPPVRFGPPVQVQPKLVALATLVDRTDLRGVVAIDVRVPSAPVLTRS